MAEYIYVFIVLFVCGLFEVYGCRWDERGLTRKGKIIRKWTGVISFAAVLLIGVMRSESMGVDWWNYRTYYFNRVAKTEWVTYIDTRLILRNYILDDGGFMVITKLIRMFTDDYWLYRAIIYAFVFSVYAVYFVRESKYISVSFTIFLTVMPYISFFLIRMSVAMAICIFANIYLKKEKIIGAVILTLLAITVHKSALVFLFPIFIRIFMKRKLSVVKIVLISSIAFIFFTLITTWLQSWYRGGLYESDGGNGGYSLMLFLIVILSLVGYSMGILRLYNREDNNYDFNFFAGAIFVQTGALIWSILTRARDYLFMNVAILAPEILAGNKTKKGRLLSYMVVMVFCLLYFGFISGVARFPYSIHQF